MSRSAEVRRPRGRGLVVLGTALVLLGVSLTVLLRPGADGDGNDRVVDAASHRGSAPSVGHVFVINLENKSFRTTWGADSAAPYLARRLRGQGVLLSHYFATAHHSLPDYVAQISGQGPSRATQADCGRYTAFGTTGPTVTSHTSFVPFVISAPGPLPGISPAESFTDLALGALTRNVRWPSELTSGERI